MHQQKRRMGFLLSVLCGLIVIVAFSQQADSPAIDPDVYKEFMSAQVLDINDLEQFFTDQQNFYLPITPPASDFILKQPGSPFVLPFAWKDFPSDFNTNLVLEYENSVPIYPVTILEDPNTRETVFLNAKGEKLFTLPPPSGYDPFAYLKTLMPSLYAGKYSSGAVDFWQGLYDPARVQVQAKLIPTESVEPYLYVQDLLAQEAKLESGGEMMMSYQGEPVTNIRFTAIEWMTNYLRVTIAYPYDGETYPENCFTSRLDIFHCSDLRDAWWDLAATTNVSASTNWIEWSDSSATASWVHVRFYTAGNADIDSDGDGFSDPRERYMYHSDPTNADSKPVAVSGSVSYSGNETGTLYALATADSNGWSIGCSASLPGPGAYTNNEVAALRSYWFKAFQDVNSSFAWETWEPWGVYSSSSTYVTSELSGIDIALSDVPSIWGSIDYTGSRTGDVYVVAVTDSNSWDTTYSCMIPWVQGDDASGGAYYVTFPIQYSIVGLPASSYWVRAFMDSDADEAFTPLETQGESDAIPVSNRVTGIDIVLDQDADSDGLPDWWETQYFGSVTNWDGSDDPDNDGLANLDEYQQGADPTCWDTDGDGYSDGDEVLLGTDPTQWDTFENGLGDGLLPADREGAGTNRWERSPPPYYSPNPTPQDLDGDGVPNWDEIIAGTDPNNVTSYLRVVNTQRPTSTNGLVIWWPSVTNREYQIESSTSLLCNSWSPMLTQWIPGTNGSLSFTDTNLTASCAFYRIAAREKDSNTNGLADWWEYKWFGALTNIFASGDEDGDGLENREEYWFTYSPTQDERQIYHSVFHSVSVSNNLPDPGPDDGGEIFDFHGGGRPLSLASNTSGSGFGSLNGEGKFSTGIYFNNDLTNLYIGISGMRIEGNNAFILFLDTDNGGVTNLLHLSTNIPPFGLSRFRNLSFDTNNFTPNVGLILGMRKADGRNYDQFTNGNNYGQGVYNLSDGGDFPGFTDTGPSRISQWARGYTGDTVSATAGIEVEIALSALNASPSSTIKVAGVFVGGTSGSYERYVSGEVYGRSVIGTLDGWGNFGFNGITVRGADVRLAGPENSLHSCAYPGFTNNDVIFQGFYWNVTPVGEWWNTLAGQVSNLAQAGFTGIWLPPPYKAANAASSVGYDPFDHRDLGEFFQKNSTRNRYGFKTDLATLVSTLIATNINIMPICDIVLNHMAGGTGTEHKIFNYNGHTNFFKSVTSFHPSVEGHNDDLAPYHDNWNFGYYPPLDIVGVDNAFLTPDMRLGLKKWGNWLVANNSFAAFRFDFTEAVEPWFIWEWLNYPGQRQRFAFMEYWKNANAQQMREWLELTGHSAAIYDWNLQTNLEQMCEQTGTFDMNLLKAPSLLGLEPNYTLTFVENHDTLQPDGTNTTPEHMGVSRQKELGYAYILHSKGCPIVYYRDYYLPPYLTNLVGEAHGGDPLKPKIDRLMLIRKETVAGGVQYLSTNTDVFVQQRDGGGTKPGSILIINDNETSTLTIDVNTMYTNYTVLVDLVVTNSPSCVTTDLSGGVTLECPPRSYRIYSVANALE